ncbi:MAG: excisionase family DNA-binding protein [Neisseria sp.]|nr:excisionase family DNA-binding protein [Neisseria sp.]
MNTIQAKKKAIEMVYVMETFNVVEAAQYCKCHPETIRAKIREGKIAAVKPGRSYCIRKAALDAYLDELENEEALASLESRSEQKCKKIKMQESINVTVDTILTSGRQAVKELDALLALKTSRKPKSCVTN